MFARLIIKNETAKPLIIMKLYNSLEKTTVKKY